MNVLGGPLTCREAMGYPSKSQGELGSSFIRGQQVQGKAIREDLQIIEQGCGGNGADYDVSETEISEMSISGRIPLDS